MVDDVVGVIGLGNMGRGIACNVARSRFSLIAWDIDPEKRQIFKRMKGVTVAPPKDMAKICNAIFFLVPASPQIQECIDGPDGIFENGRPGLVLIDLTASDPRQTQQLAREAKKRNIGYIDAGTSGGPKRADSGELLLMVGGDKDVFERSEKYLEVIAKHIHYLGKSGAGHTLKLIHNNLTFAVFVATCEAGHQAEQFGIRLANMIEIFNRSNARSYATEEKFPQHILSEKWDGRSSVYLLYKDLGLGLKMCRRTGADANLTRATFRFVEKAIAAGMAESDYTLLYRDYETIRSGGKTRKGRSRPRKASRGTK